MSESADRLARLLLVDQHRRWALGRPEPVEFYLEQHPVLRTDPEGLLDLLYNEICLRERHGQAVSLADYQRRFPELARPLALQMEVHQALPVAERTVAPRVAPTIHGYTLLDELGHGSMAVVYRARQLDRDRLVALKIVRAELALGPHELARFRAEAAAVGRLRHPNIVRLYKVGLHETRPYFTLELAAGSLAGRLTGQPWPVAAAAQLVGQLAGAVHFAHEHGVVHRDLKPANVLLAADGTPKVADFGLAKLRDADARLTPSGMVVGTPGYMAPEQLRGDARHVGPAADVYGLGAILYELLTGRPPTPPHALLAAAFSKAAPPETLRPDLPADLAAVCVRCLRTAPERRYPSAAHLARDLRRFLHGRPVHARRRE
jgi:serine/threonine protein kinase